METDSQDPTTVLAEELQSLLDLLGRPKDADVVALLVAPSPGGPTRADHIAGIPGVASTAALATLVTWFLALVQKLLESGAEKSGEKAAEWIAARLGQSRRRGDYTVSERLKTVAEIANALEVAGWPKDLVKRTADELWSRSEIVARRLATR